ncbi:class I SAM-dependent methyltransferase [Vibrio sp.]|uniref:Class I SAM-dependent methyltransferase n=1 Tax=Vibrio viridaestus TaxID=2487322 RepID=A0A3N9U2W4_9VIBR|nr:class I SAM-dependent methyltransferase [Vibrio viridaestus]MDC0609169.1 class I SAM-dependent methyltransferase [Vibrio sp.]RQW62326.1 class I SAM-dependent methyltransferase [Vibrio viridaestus]
MVMEYYNINAHKFFDGTFQINMDKIYQAFLNRIPEGGLIMDAGCGSGRDALAFTEQGYHVLAFDEAEKLVDLAKEKTGLNIECSSFLDFYTEPSSVDGIWACASLLHTPVDELGHTLTHLMHFLKPEGIIYCSFKYGAEDTELEDGRFFTNMNESKIDRLAAETNVSIRHLWITEDLRVERKGEKWLNVLLMKKAES